MEQSLKRSIILEHYQNPKNKCLLNDDSYEKINMNNESCIDEINLEIKYVDSGSEHYNDQVAVGLIGDQSVHKDVLLSTVSNLTVYVVNSKNTNSNQNTNTTKNTENKNDNSKSDAIIKGFID